MIYRPYVGTITVFLWSFLAVFCLLCLCTIATKYFSYFKRPLASSQLSDAQVLNNTQALTEHRILRPAKIRKYTRFNAVAYHILHMHLQT